MVATNAMKYGVQALEKEDGDLNLLVRRLEKCGKYSFSGYI